jgi:uncharacterized lipoprotein YajG
MGSGCHIVGGASPPGESLDVEQIGSVYEGIMGYTVNRATSISIGVNSKPKGSKHSTTVVVDVEGLLAAKSGDLYQVVSCYFTLCVNKFQVMRRYFTLCVNISSYV